MLSPPKDQVKIKLSLSVVINCSIETIIQPMISTEHLVSVLLDRPVIAVEVIQPAAFLHQLDGP